jgi:transcriptional regulator with XRE-family HTH domain
LSAYERGSRSPSLDALQKVAAAAGFQLRVSVEPLAADVAQAVQEVDGTPVDQWLDDLGMLWVG